MTNADKPAIPPRKTGLAHFFAAASYSLAGFQRLWKEAAFRHEVGVGLIGLALVAYFSDAAIQVVGFVVLWLMLAATEAMNTAIEVLVDHLSPQWAEFAKAAKDLGSFACACMITATVLYAAWIVVF